MIRKEYPQYDSDNLQKTLDEIGNMKHKALMEFYALKEENEILKERLDKLRDDHKKNTKRNVIQNDIKLLEGRTIQKTVIIKAEYGRTYDRYLAIVCDDGTRIMVTGGTSPYSPNIDLKEMEESEFFTQDEIQKKKDFISAKIKQSEEDCKRRKEEELRRLQKELDL